MPGGITKYGMVQRIIQYAECFQEISLWGEQKPRFSVVGVGEKNEVESPFSGMKRLENFHQKNKLLESTHRLFQRCTRQRNLQMLVSLFLRCQARQEWALNQT